MQLLHFFVVDELAARLRELPDQSLIPDMFDQECDGEMLRIDAVGRGRRGQRRGNHEYQKYRGEIRETHVILQKPGSTYANVAPTQYATTARP